METSVNTESSQNSKNIFRNTNFMLLLTGQIVSNLGNSIFNVAVSWYIMSLLAENNPGLFMAIYGLCTLIPTLIFGPLSGVFVDMHSRKQIIVGTDIIRGLLMLFLALLTYLEIIPLIMLFTVTILNAFFGTFFNPAVFSSIPNLVKKDHLLKANSLNGISMQLSNIIGAAISGFLYYFFGIIGVFMINGISFILSGIWEAFIKMPKTNTQKTDKAKTHFWTDFKEGIHYIKQQKPLLILVGLALIINIIFSPVFSILIPKSIKFILGMTAKELGILESIMPIGAILGMALMTFKTLKIKNYKLLVNCTIVQGISISLFGVPLILFSMSYIGNNVVLIIFCGLSLILGISSALLKTPIHTAFQRLVDDEYRGRFFGIFTTLTQGTIPLGLVLFGILSDSVQLSTLFIVAGVIITALGVSILKFPELKEL